MSPAPSPPRGVGVIDTTSLWGAASHLGGQSSRTGDPEEIFDHPIRELSATNVDHFLTLLHHIILYDEIRTDFSILTTEEDWYQAQVRQLIGRLSPVLEIRPIPTTVTDYETMDLILDQFIAQTRADFRSSSPSAAFRQMGVVAGASRYTETDVDYLSSHIPPAILAQLKALITEYGYSAFDGQTPQSILVALVRQLSVLTRTIRYCAHSHHVQEHDGVPSSFCAAPRRIEVLRDYMAHDEFARLREIAHPPSKLFARLGLPKTGYDFSAFSPSIKPLSASDLWRAVQNLPPAEALARVLDLRETAEAKEIRGTWAARLWAGGSEVVEGLGQSMKNIVASGDVIQLIIASPHVTAVSRPDRRDVDRKHDLGVWSRCVVVRCSTIRRGKRYGTGSTRQRPHDGGGPSSDTAE